MSRPNVHLVASIYEAAKRQDIQAVTAVLHPEMTVTQSSEFHGAASTPHREPCCNCLVRSVRVSSQNSSLST